MGTLLKLYTEKKKNQVLADEMKRLTWEVVEIHTEQIKEFHC